MAGYVIFVRYFVAYTPSFPFDCFVHLKDEDINGAVETLRQAWWSEPANRTRFEAWRIDTQRRRIESEVQLRGRFYQGAPIPALPPGNVQCLSVMVPPAAGLRVQMPSLIEIATCVGWRKWYSEEFLPHCISPRFPVARFDTKELAEDAATSLRARVLELASGADATHNRDGRAVLFASANPRFVVVGEKELSRPELVTAREQIQRLRGPASGTPTMEERFLRGYWSLIRLTLEMIETLSVAETVPAATAEVVPVATAEVVPVAAAEVVGDPQEPDGPFGTDGFRFRGVEVRFRRAALPRKLVLALWDEKNRRPQDARQVEDVLSQVYGEAHQTEDATFRQLCTDTRGRFQAVNMALDIECLQGKVQLIPRPG